jgi:hypothetical protein
VIPPILTLVNSRNCTELATHPKGTGLSDRSCGSWQGFARLRCHPSSRAVVFRDLSAVTMRSCAGLTSDKLTRCFGRSTAGRTTHSKCISGIGFLLHVGVYDAPNPKRTYVQFCTIKVSACDTSAVHPPTYPSLGRSHRPRRTRRGCLLVTVGTVPACGSRSLDHWHPRYYAVYATFAAFASLAALGLAQ